MLKQDSLICLATEVTESRFPSKFSAVLSRYSAVYLILSPPRCSSTAFARVLWEAPSIGFYSHEPFEATYYEGRDLNDVLARLENPIDLSAIKKVRSAVECGALVLKDMPYQVGRNFPLLCAMVTQPLVLLIRDPRLGIASRMAKKREVGDKALFPKLESGWDLLAEQARLAKSVGLDYIIVDATDFRNEPIQVFSKVFEQLGLEFSREVLAWKACPGLEIDNLGGKHRHLYKRVLESTGLTPAAEPTPPMEFFPRAQGFRDHVSHCLEIYQMLADAEERIHP